MRDDTTLTSKVIEKIPNKYMAVIVASRRARAINSGSRTLVKSTAAKPTTVALEEIAADHVVPDTSKPALDIEREEELMLASSEETEAEILAANDMPFMRSASHSHTGRGRPLLYKSFLPGPAGAEYRTFRFQKHPGHRGTWDQDRRTAR